MKEDKKTKLRIVQDNTYHIKDDREIRNKSREKGGDAEYKPTIHALFIVWQKPSSVDPALSEHLAERIPNPRDVCCLFAVRICQREDTCDIANPTNLFQ